jgi:hypothetical protein
MVHKSFPRARILPGVFDYTFEGRGRGKGGAVAGAGNVGGRA